MIGGQIGWEWWCLRVVLSWGCAGLNYSKVSIGFEILCQCDHSLRSIFIWWWRWDIHRENSDYTGTYRWTASKWMPFAFVCSTCVSFVPLWPSVSSWSCWTSWPLMSSLSLISSRSCWTSCSLRTSLSLISSLPLRTWRTWRTLEGCQTKQTKIIFFLNDALVIFSQTWLVNERN